MFTADLHTAALSGAFLGTSTETQSVYRNLWRLARSQAGASNFAVARAYYDQGHALYVADGSPADLAEEDSFTEAAVSGDASALASVAAGSESVAAGASNQPSFLDRVIGNAPQAQAAPGVSFETGLDVGSALERKVAPGYVGPPQSGRELATQKKVDEALSSGLSTAEQVLLGLAVGIGLVGGGILAWKVFA